MLLPGNIHPELSIYYNAAFVLEALKNVDNQPIIDLYHGVKNKKGMSFPSFVLCLDWLYLIDVAKINEEGRVKLCS
ncbi:MAG: hypothetical protein LBP73_10555 [Clostridiales Family XIII bacterium]|jgi:hypothetical protein|nr:hypothetical protein [Clostridiales Family XIII bacterium]